MLVISGNRAETDSGQIRAKGGIMVILMITTALMALLLTATMYCLLKR